MTNDSDLEKALEHIQNRKYHKALEHIDQEADMTLYAEVERLSYTLDAVNNYTDRIVSDIAEKLEEKKGGK